MLIRCSVRAEQFLSRLIERDEAEYDSLNALIIPDRSPARAFHEAEVEADAEARGEPFDDPYPGADNNGVDNDNNAANNKNGVDNKNGADAD